jgi:hypothetical protein
MVRRMTDRAFDPRDDFERSLEVAYGAVRERVAAGGPSWHPTDLGKQAAAVERAAMNWRGHVDNLRDLSSRGRRPVSEYEAALAWVPDLEAAAKTMRALCSVASRVSVNPERGGSG